MTVPHSATTCDLCHGTGTVPHTKRTIEDGKADPWDHQLVELCSKCSGAGVVHQAPPRNIPETVVA